MGRAIDKPLPEVGATAPAFLCRHHRQPLTFVGDAGWKYPCCESRAPEVSPEAAMLAADPPAGPNPSELRWLDPSIAELGDKIRDSIVESYHVEVLPIACPSCQERVAIEHSSRSVSDGTITVTPMTVRSAAMLADPDLDADRGELDVPTPSDYETAQRVLRFTAAETTRTTESYRALKRVNGILRMDAHARRNVPERELCGSFGCTLPAGHNMGRADVPENHGVPVNGTTDPPDDELESVVIPSLAAAGPDVEWVLETRPDHSRWRYFLHRRKNGCGEWAQPYSGPAFNHQEDARLAGIERRDAIVRIEAERDARSTFEALS